MREGSSAGHEIGAFDVEAEESDRRSGEARSIIAIGCRRPWKEEGDDPGPQCDVPVVRVVPIVFVEVGASSSFEPSCE